MWSWLNSTRLRDYPRLILVASWSVLLLNVIFQHGWIGGLTGVMIGGDFISNYSGGVIYRTNIEHLYDPAYQQDTQAQVIAPNQSPGFAPFISPPYVALMMSWVASFPLPFALAVWEIINLISVALSAVLITKYLIPAAYPWKNLPAYQLFIIIISSFAFVDGFLAGQSHGIILLLCTGILVAMMKEKWLVSGVLGSLLIYKPQFVLGFLVCWFIWGRVRALVGFGIFAGLWQVPVIAAYGWMPYAHYLQFTQSLLYLPYAKEGFPVSVMATPYAFLATLLPMNFSRALQVLFLIIGVVTVSLLSYIAYKSRNQPANMRHFTYAFAILVPLVVAPHTLIYDLLILVPGLVLLATIEGMSSILKTLSVIFYACLLFFPLLGYGFKLALPGIIPAILLFFVIKGYFRTKMTVELSLN